MEFAEQVKASVDLVEVVNEYVKLRKNGSRYVGLCPFHTEKTPSFGVNSLHQYYKCFGCGAGGDVFRFVMEVANVDFLEALKMLAGRAGLAMPARPLPQDPESKLRAAILEMHAAAAEAFSQNLQAPGGAEARQYLAGRGLTPATVEQFSLGLADRSGQQLTQLLAPRYGRQALEESGLVKARPDGSGFYDMFRGRLMFPIHDEGGKTIGFGGRALAKDEEPKYLNSPTTRIYNKSFVLYNLHRAKQAIRREDYALLVEGYMDVIGVSAAGFVPVVAPCGTALRETQVRALKRHALNIVVNFDADEAGREAAERSIATLLDEGLNVRILELEGGLDPDEYIRKHGPDAYRQRLRNATGYFVWLAGRARAKFGMRTAEERMKGLAYLRPAIQRLSGKLERAAVADEVAAYLGLERSLVLDEFRRSAVQNTAPKIAGKAGAGAQVPAPVTVPAAERVLLRSLAGNAEVRALLAPKLASSPLLQKLAIAPLLDVLLRLQDAQPDFSFAALEDRLPPEARAILSAVIFGEGSEEMFDLPQAEAYLRVLEREEKKDAAAILRARIREAERGGDMRHVLELTAELSQLQRG